MARIKWDETGERLYETGTKKGVFYSYTIPAGSDTGVYSPGVAWNGLTSFSQSPDGGESNDIYADDTKYLSLRSKENFKGTIEAYTYPEEFAECNGESMLIAGVHIGQQTRKSFGFSYVSTIGNDVQYDDFGYKIHLIWGATAAPSEKQYQTINDSPEAITFSWEIDTIPVEVVINGTTYKPTAHMEIDSTKFKGEGLPEKLTALENVLYGDAEHEPMLPMPAEVVSILQTGSYTYPTGT